MPRGDRDAPEGRAGRGFARPPATACALAAAAAAAAFRACSRALPAFFSALARAARSRLAALRAFFSASRAFSLALRAASRRCSCSCAGEKISHAAASPAVHPHSRSSARSWSTPAGPATRRTVFSDGATWTPARLLSGQPSALSTRCGRLAAHSPTAVNESHPASRAAIATAITHATVNRTPRRSRGSGSRASQSHSDAGGPGSGENTWAAVTDWTGNGATFRTETSAIPVLPGLRCSSPAGRAAIRRILPISPAGHPGSQEHAPAAPAPPGAYAGHPRTRTPLTQRDQPPNPANHSPLHLLCRDPGRCPRPFIRRGCPSHVVPAA